MIRLHCAVVFCGLAACGFAQTGVRPEPVGSVTGHVMCADTQRPARLAAVKLVKVPGKDEAKADLKKNSMGDAAPAGDAVETGLDGSYTIRNVKPGEYYVVVDETGYLVPLGAFSLKDLSDPTVETKAQMAKTVHAISINADQTTREDVTLERGASVSGTVLYDDGSPASGISIQILAKNKEGKWEPMKSFRYRSSYGYASTDDNGQYRLTGLPAGEYATEANFSISDHETSFAPMPNVPGNMMEVQFTKVRFSLPLYSGDVLRKPDAKSYSLGSGEVRAGSDLVFPLAKLHKVGGQIVAKDGHTVNGGNIALLYADDKTKLTETDVQYEDAAFHLDFVPEGDFLVEVTGAKDVTRIQVENPPGYTPRFHEDSKTVKTYGEAEQPLTIKGDVQDVVAMVPDSKSSAGAATTK